MEAELEWFSGWGGFRNGNQYWMAPARERAEKGPKTFWNQADAMDGRIWCATCSITARLQGWEPERHGSLSPGGEP